MAKAEGAVGGKIELSGFNNLTKTVAINLYELCVVRGEAQRAAYVSRIDRDFGAPRISEILRGVAAIIDAEVLSVSTQDYEPHGASALMLMSDLGQAMPQAAAHAWTPSVGAHLDKSHLCAHTYPDWEDPQGVCSLRVDIEISTCGTIMPLRALDFLLERVHADVVTVDYLVRGFTRDKAGKRVYLDHSVDTIVDFIAPEQLAAFEHQCTRAPSTNTWHARLMRRALDPARQLQGSLADDQQAHQLLVEEKRAVYAGR